MTDHERLTQRDGYTVSGLSIEEAEEQGLAWAQLCHPDGSYTLYVKPEELGE